MNERDIELRDQATLEGRDAINLAIFADLIRADERKKVIAEFVKSGAVSEDGAIVTAIRARGNT